MSHGTSASLFASMWRITPLKISAVSTSALSSTGRILIAGRFCRPSFVTCAMCSGSLLIVSAGRFWISVRLL